MRRWSRQLFRPTGDGRFEVRLGDEVRDLLGALPAQMREMLAEGTDPGLQRLFPPAYVSDEQHEAEYRRLMGDDLSASHVAALDVLEATAHASHLDVAQLTAWMRAVNEVRLVLGTHLDVSEDDDSWTTLSDDDPRAAAYGRYALFGVLQEHMVAALSETL
jgi:hypothetical protein